MAPPVCLGPGVGWTAVVANKHGLPVQSFVRRCLCVKHLRAENQREFDEIFGQYAYTSELPPTITAEDAFLTCDSSFSCIMEGMTRNGFGMFVII